MQSSIDIKLTSQPIDCHDIEAIVLSFFEDEKPLRGATALIDWRLCGAITRLVHRGRITGIFGETLLMSPQKHSLPSKILIFGLGPSGSFSLERMESYFHCLGEVLFKMGVFEVAFSLPGASAYEMNPRNGARHVFEGIISDWCMGEKEISYAKLVIVDDESRLGELNAGFRQIQEKIKGRVNLTVSMI